jgi:hypothetical protein
MSKKELDKLMQKRNPLPSNREQITPANLYDNASIPASQHTGTPANQLASTPASPPTVKPTSLTTGKPASQHTGKQAVTKYTTYLNTDTVKRLKRYAFDNEIKATKVIQEAIDKYLRGKGA